ncbi:phosphatidic acid phosphatase [Thraustotheca clavata]|uniref:Phosphatidic acid phosphatase n=1 Tax=Thraustotheca clavata TaxID=74557 RepID=A0A1W0A0M6_9STRA|nr:phosphatidic acid phosphatase [Thraustotheca clavata]
MTTSWQVTMHQKRLLEYGVCVLILIVSLIVSLASLYHRDIPAIAVPLDNNKTVYIRDPTLNYKKLKQQVPMYLCVILAYAIPVVAHILVQWQHRIPNDTRDFFLSLFVTSAVCQLFTNIIKQLAGRFRPSFYDMCDWNSSVMWDGIENLCRDKSGETEGRKSFPSGHSSTAFSTLFFLTLYLFGRFKVVDIKKVGTSSYGRHYTASIKFFLAMLPTILAVWIAVTRSMDNWHHYSDIAAGAFIGIISAILAYTYNYAPVFNYKSAGLPLETYYQRKCRDTTVQPLTEP